MTCFAVVWATLTLDHKIFIFCFLLQTAHTGRSSSKIVRKHFASHTIWNNLGMVTETRSYSFRRSSQCHRRRVCFSPNSLLSTALACTSHDRWHGPTLQAPNTPTSARHVQAIPMGWKWCHTKGTYKISERARTSYCLHDWSITNIEAARICREETWTCFQLERVSFSSPSSRVSATELFRGKCQRLRWLWTK